jgi:hypothetical protein
MVSAVCGPTLTAYLSHGLAVSLSGIAAIEWTAEPSASAIGTSAVFDILGFSRRVRDAGVSAKQAEAHAETARDCLMAEPATKADIADLKGLIERQSVLATVRMGACDCRRRRLGRPYQSHLTPRRAGSSTPPALTRMQCHHAATISGC